MGVQGIKGIYVALITPFTHDQGSIDFHALDEHINRLIDAGVHGLVPGGSTGEFTALSTEERKQLLEAVVKSANGRVGIMAGIGDLSTAKTIDLAEHAAKVGADSLMVAPPFYDAPSLDELRAHLSDIHKASGLPIVYYNIPSATGVSLTTAEIASLSEVGVQYLKDTSGNAPALTDLIFNDELSSRVTVFNGWDTLTFYGLAAGAEGSVWGATNIVPELSMKLWEAVAVRGDLKEGREIWKKIFPICKLLESGNYAAFVKTGMELRGWKTGGMRKPYNMTKSEGRTKLATALRNAGVSIDD
ncbi:Dihydrodipicolinate synthetase-like protein [Cordyceps fumosorosea ARSEF 2679]|uniref:Dihydrodipicolinate synthetase-like protein n=1 Tax=Cordyceps fumosorosea (strain ARSEF 2679) TaxID=1081104 RepID=A0A167PZL4_CORFA|nr:Dihydrodipicolinate synthetase-like protein [Cordyceps fumosorosea ARSEF 2679]OAA57158.1 Dihydrodipicolinate synthetase-like protein [Cordyceps fumosorosea ARSEF 2679]